MATTSQIPEFIDALCTVAVNALATSVTVVDGPPLSWDPLNVAEPSQSEQQFLFVGARPDDDTAAAGRQDRTTMGSGRSEDIDVACTVFVSGGDAVLKPLRDQAFGVIAALEQAIRVDQTLGGQVATSRVSSVDRLDQTQNDHGSDCTALFTVTGKAFLR
jgi:hypothetical protein